MQPGDNESKLLDRIRNGDQSAFEQLFRSQYPNLLDFATAWCGSRDVADEIISDVFLWLYLNRNKIAPKTTLTAYLIGAVRNRAMNVWRGEGRADARHQALYDDQINSALSPEDEYLEREQSEEQARKIAAALAPLSQMARSIFILRTQRGLSYEEIAEATGISSNAAKTQFSRALGAVKGALRG